ncbi:hypothetical protein M0R45_015096 [Rubus argutus]|uniref:CC-NBS-LRR protein n=1 Tax=Rubus argutus TaxID=59490 RepID=A0AAW1XQP4_RUBAR
MYISNCEKLKIDIQNLNSLEELSIEDCGGLHKLTSLRDLSILGIDDRDLVSFPTVEKENKNEMMLQLPKSLVYIHINGFPNLKKLSNNFQFLTSLEQLDICDCPKLASIPEEGLPRSLERLEISMCPLLEERCKGRYWPKIARIPFVQIDNKLIHK